LEKFWPFFLRVFFLPTSVSFLLRTAFPLAFPLWHVPCPLRVLWFPPVVFLSFVWTISVAVKSSNPYFCNTLVIHPIFISGT
jgi:hypothetical protein